MGLILSTTQQEEGEGGLRCRVFASTTQWICCVQASAWLSQRALPAGQLLAFGPEEDRATVRRLSLEAASLKLIHIKPRQPALGPGCLSYALSLA